MLFEKLNTFFHDKDTSALFVAKGVVSLDVVTKYEMYQHYHYLKQQYCDPYRAKRETAAKYKCSWLTVHRCVQFMEG